MGIKHCGKSTQARRLSSHFGCPCFDTDDIITELTGKSPRELYQYEGVQAFMDAEEKACLEVTSRIGSEGAVIATGGGICNNEKAIAVLRQAGTLIFLNAEEKTAADRIVREVHITEDGSLLNLPAYIAKENPHSIEEVRASFHRFYETRVKKYAAVCDIRIDLGNLQKEENTRRIIDAVLQSATATAAAGASAAT